MQLSRDMPWTGTQGFGTLLNGTLTLHDINQKPSRHPAQPLAYVAIATPKYVTYISVKHRDNKVDKVWCIDMICFCNHVMFYLTIDYTSLNNNNSLIFEPNISSYNYYHLNHKIRQYVLTPTCRVWILRYKYVFKNSHGGVNMHSLHIQSIHGL